MATMVIAKPRLFISASALLTPTGETADDYTKITSVPGFEKKYSVPGDQPIPLADTEYGRIASPICFDMDFDGLIRQVGRGNADLLLVPPSDWKDIIPLHQPMAEFRAIETAPPCSASPAGAVPERLIPMVGGWRGWRISARRIT